MHSVERTYHIVVESVMVMLFSGTGRQGKMPFLSRDGDIARMLWAMVSWQKDWPGNTNPSGSSACPSTYPRRATGRQRQVV